MSKQDQINQLHATYCHLSRLVVPLSMPRIYAWEHWLAHKWTAEDLALAIHYVLKHAKSPESTLRFRYFIDPENFAEYLAPARANARKPSHDPAKTIALKATGRSAEPAPTQAKTPDQIMRESKLLRSLLEKEGL